MLWARPSPRTLEEDVELHSPVKMCRQAAIYSQLFAAFFTLDFPMNLLVGRETQSLLPTAFIMLPVTANHFDRAGLRLYIKF